jgi:hypothetical protein
VEEEVMAVNVWHALAPGDPAPAIESQLEARALLTGFHGLGLPVESVLLGQLTAQLRQAHPTLIPVPMQNATSAEALRCALSEMTADATDMTGLLELLDARVRAFEVTPGSPILGQPHDQVMAGVMALVDVELAASVAAMYEGGQHSRPQQPWLGYLSRIRSYRRPADRLGHAHLTANPESPAFRANLSPEQARTLTGALKQMPAVRRALGATLGAPDPRRDAPHSWLDGLDIRTDADSTFEETESNRPLTARDLPDTARRIALACQMIANLVDPGVLGGVPSPVFHVVRRNAEEHNIRAYSEGGSVHVHVDQESPVRVIAHEIGHVLENVRPIGCWLDIQRLLHLRHDVQMTDALVPIHPNHPDEQVRRECAYRAVMPATGLYSARAYPGPGPTECMSMSVELLCAGPAEAAALIERDPALAAIVLRWLAPFEFIATVPQRAWLVAIPTPPQL